MIVSIFIYFLAQLETPVAFMVRFSNDTLNENNYKDGDPRTKDLLFDVVQYGRQYYNTSTGQFTAPSDGHYLLSLTVSYFHSLSLYFFYL